jgi:hypothetical protein
VSDPHDWNSWDNYQTIHEKVLEEHAFILENQLEWTVVPGRNPLLVLEGELVCEAGVSVSVYKVLETRVNSRGRPEVRGWKYSYNARFAGRHNILRYDNIHATETLAEEEFHRHDFDLSTGRELSVTLLHRHDLPVLSEFLNEVAELVGFH